MEIRERGCGPSPPEFDTLVWVLPQFLYNLWTRPGGGRGRVRQDTGTEKFETGTPIHLPLDRFEPVDLPLDLAGDPRRVYGRCYCGDIFLDDPRWLTYKQAQDRGWQVRRGEKGTQIEFWEVKPVRENGTPSPRGDENRGGDTKNAAT